MGYSCAAAASETFDAIRQLVGGRVSNALPNDAGFYEASRVEHDDGSITGSVFRTVRRLTDAERIEAAARQGGECQPSWIGDPCRRAGSFKIAGNGKIIRFPMLPTALKREAERMGAERMQQLYGRDQ